MEKKDLSFASISELSPLIESQEVKPTELLESCIEQIDSQDSTINAFITTTFDLAREQLGLATKLVTADFKRSAIVSQRLRDVVSMEEKAKRL